ncbi:MAG TPA: TraM recognition domain-containing protein [Candidatus Paceibacterota bacterium]|nr:TraM recognition domain-containing protein [Candidatus Paceibacterota bacterium]
MPSTLERTKPTSQEKFKTPQEELAYLRERVAEKEREIDSPDNRFERDRLAKREIRHYADIPSARILHEAYVLPEHETLRQVLKLDPEAHDKQIDGLLKVVHEHGIRNALSVVSRMKNPHLEDDLHRALVRYIAEGLPDRGMAPPEKVRRALELVLFEVTPQAHASGENGGQEKKLESLLSSSEQLYAGLMSLIGPHESFSLEIAVPQGTEEASLYLAVPRPRKELAERLIASVFSNARITENRGDYNIFNFGGESAAAYATLAEHAALPIKTYESFEHDPLNIVLAAFAKIAKHDEGAALQIVVGNEGDRYNRHYRKMLRELEKGKTFEEAVKVPETTFGELIHEVADVVMHPNETDQEREKRDMKRAPDSVASEALGRKIKHRIAPSTIRIVASAPTHARAKELLANIESSLGQFDDATGNRFVVKHVSQWNLSGFLRAFTFREFDSSLSMPLSLSEITSLFHFTAEHVTTSREFKKSYAKQAPAPVEMPSDGITIGINKYGASETPVRFAPSDRLRHAYVIGQTGTGKSGLIKNMIIQDIKNGEGVAFIDPHGVDIEDILAAIPPERIQDVIYFDPAYTARPMGLNMLEYDRSKPEMKTFVIDEVYGIFRKLYSDVPEAFGPMFEQYYRNAVQLVLEDPESGCTFMEVPRVFADTEFRNLKISRCNNPVIVQFWRKIAEAAGGDASLENITPYISSKFDVFLANDIMRPIVSQEHSAFNFREVMDGKKIFLANLSKGKLGDRNTSLLGLVLVSKFLQAAFSRSDSHSKDLPTFYLYIDEFQNFATPSIATILSEARKYKLSLTIAHQFIAQLEENIRDAVIGNVGTKVAMRIGTTDAEFLEKQFAPTFTAKDLENLPNYHGVCALLVNGSPARPFTIETLPPPSFDYTYTADLKELSYQTYGKAREEVEAEIRERFGQ